MSFVVDLKPERAVVSVSCKMRPSFSKRTMTFAGASDANLLLSALSFHVPLKSGRIWAPTAPANATAECVSVEKGRLQIEQARADSFLLLLRQGLRRTGDRAGKRLHQRRQIVIDQGGEICVTVGWQSGGELRRMIQCRTRIVIRQCLFDQRSRWAGNHIAIRKHVVDFHAESCRTQCVKGPSAGIGLVQ